MNLEELLLLQMGLPLHGVVASICCLSKRNCQHQPSYYRLLVSFVYWIMICTVNSSEERLLVDDWLVLFFPHASSYFYRFLVLTQQFSGHWLIGINTFPCFFFFSCICFLLVWIFGSPWILHNCLELCCFIRYTIFATHMEGLSEMATIYPNVKILHFEVDLRNNRLDFKVTIWQFNFIKNFMMTPFCVPNLLLVISSISRMVHAMCHIMAFFWLEWLVYQVLWLKQRGSLQQRLQKR